MAVLIWLILGRYIPPKAQQRKPLGTDDPAAAPQRHLRAEGLPGLKEDMQPTVTHRSFEETGKARGCLGCTPRLSAGEHREPAQVH